tara:strand:+ start:7731 stop:7982 length:252 start_codon:yes stop_codon:yes gene_type:complete
MEASSQILTSLLENSLVFGIMGVIIFWLSKRYEKSEEEKSELAKEVIKLTVAYENKIDNDKLSDAEIKGILLQIRDSISKWEK